VSALVAFFAAVAVITEFFTFPTSFSVFILMTDFYIYLYVFDIAELDSSRQRES
jgi:hypothetical protein